MLNFEIDIASRVFIRWRTIIHSNFFLNNLLAKMTIMAIVYYSLYIVHGLLYGYYNGYNIYKIYTSNGFFLFRHAVGFIMFHTGWNICATQKVSPLLRVTCLKIKKDQEHISKNFTYFLTAAFSQNKTE